MTLETELRAHVEQVLSGPGAEQALHDRIEAFAAEGGTRLGPNDKDGLTEFCTGYVRAVVDLLVACDGAAARAGALPFAGPVLQTAAGYFLHPVDFIPDDSGVFGLLDDAYLACRFVARISGMVAAARGVPLLDTSLDQRSPVVRLLIGEPLAMRLDAEVERTLAQVAAQLQMAQATPWQVSPSAWNRWVQGQNAVNAEAEILAIAGGSF